MTRLWRTLEQAVTLRGAENDWRRWLGTEFEPLRRFLRPTAQIVSSRLFDDDPKRWSVAEIEGQYFARNNDTFEVRELERSEVVSNQFDVRLLANEIAERLKASGVIEVVGSTQHIVRVGELPASLGARPAYICTKTWTPDLIEAIGAMARHASGPFVLLHPTGHAIDSQVRSWLAKADAHVIALSELIQVTGDGGLTVTPQSDRLIRQTLGIQSEDTPQYRFQQDDDFWWVAFHTKPRPVKDATGMPYIAHLLARPNETITAMHLEAMEAGLYELIRTGTRGEKTDEKTLRDSHDRLAAIANELDDAIEFNDVAAITALQTEREGILEYVKKATGLAGSIQDQSDTKRAGDSVSRAIRRAFNEIDKKCPEAADHLRAHLQTGIDLLYSPPEVVDWQL